MKLGIQYVPHAVALLLVTALIPSLAEKEPQREEREMLAHAAEISDIRSPGIPPFRMRAQVRIILSGDKPLEGTYLLLWNSPSQWREELTFPGYKRIRVGGEDKYWQQRTTDYEPLRMFEFTRTLDFQSFLRLGPEDTVREVKDKKRSGLSLKCVEVRRPSFVAGGRVCLDTDTGRLVREERLEGEVEKEYSEYIPWGGKVFPGVLRTTEGGKRVVEMRVEEISANASPDPAIYQPPPGSEAWAWCNNPDRGRVLDRVQPVYPAQAKLELRSGKVSVYAVIGVNGRLTNLRIARSAGPDLDNATLDAVKRWRYRPTSCNGVSIRDEVVIDVVYSFQR